ncbi:MAG: hypothetical protein IE931_01995 [Sphingobacteriales bacterium]|nr:hypothetical protein [Sphingobacteriales bacterium]
MDIFDEELLKLWRNLNESQVEYILVGDFASHLHAKTGFGTRIEIWLKDTISNRKKLRKAFKNYGHGDFAGIEKMQFVAGWTTFRLENALEVDIITQLKGLEDSSFDEAFNLASKADILYVNVPFLHINQLIQAKKAANRPKDQIDVMALERIKKLREEE